MICRRFNKCYFPKDQKVKKFGVEDTIKYIESCRNYGTGCELTQLNDSQFKIFERTKKGLEDKTE